MYEFDINDTDLNNQKVIESVEQEYREEIKKFIPGKLYYSLGFGKYFFILEIKTINLTNFVKTEVLTCLLNNKIVNVLLKEQVDDLTKSEPSSEVIESLQGLDPFFRHFYGCEQYYFRQTISVHNKLLSCPYAFYNFKMIHEIIKVDEKKIFL